MSNYTKATNFAVKDGLVTTDPAKIIKGVDIDNEYNAISNAIASKADITSPSLLGTPTAPTATLGTNTTQIASTAFVKAALDNEGLGTIATQDANAVAITGGTITGITDLAVADGGTGASTLTSKAVLIGNGTSAVTSVAPGTSGNVLKSDGTDWVASPLKGLGLGGEVWNNVTSSRSFNTVYTNSRSYPILVSATTNQTGPSPYVDGYVGGNLITRWVWQFNGSGAYGGTTLLVPPGATYELRSGQSVSNWVELY